jgi:uncharacterized phiE125 gp8 family phage protein
VHKTELVTAPAVELLTVSEAKAHLRFTGSSKDAEITRMIKAFRTSIERYLHRALITQTWKVYYDCWHNEMKIPFGNLQLVTGQSTPTVIEKRPLIKYRDDAGTLTELTESTYYWVVKSTDPACIVRKYDVTYPELQSGRPDAIEITFQCGYGSAATDVPEDIIHALKVMLTDYFEHPGSIVIGDRVNRIPDHITALIHNYKLYEF